MKNILKIFLTDSGRIFSNVVAMVVIMGLCVLPSLYAWFNIFSNWDPYGQESTSNLQIAVYSEDRGDKIAGEDVNIGSSVLDGLKANKTIGWVFAESKKEAIEGVYSGKYYAALVIPENFTKDMVSFLGGTVEHPAITYYENDKKNAIAPKITAKAKTAVQEQVNASFVSTITDAMVGAGKVITASDSQGDNPLDSGINTLQNMDTELQIYIAVMSSFVNITDAAQGLIDTSQNMLPGVKDTFGQSKQMVKSLETVLNFSVQTEHYAGDMFSLSMDAIRQSLDNIRGGISQDRDTVKAAGDTVDAATQAAIQEAAKRSAGMLSYVNSMFGSTIQNIIGTDPEVDRQIREIQSQLSAVQDNMKKISEKNDLTVEDTNTLLDQSISTMGTIITEIKELEAAYEDTVEPQFDKSMDSAQNALTRAEAALSSMDSDFDMVSPVLDNYENTLKNGKGNLKDSLSTAQGVSAELERIISELNKVRNDDQYKELVKILKEDPDSLGKFISSPVNLETKGIYPIATYGSAMTPFYTVLALWVGALILVAIVHVRVEPIEGMQIRPYQAFFGRYILFFLVGQIQTTITILGDLLYIKIQCSHPFLFWLAGAMTSFTFTLFIYSLTVAFQNIGEALAVVIMVIQVAGAGGTFPIEVLPKAYQVMYRFLPFPYAMNSMRETIGGMYGNDYWDYLLHLSAYIVVALVIGLVLGKPFRSLNRMIDRSKEQAEIML
ncbi:MAG: YhgE/Pip domain-containing protein [Butyrivibrio sp.]|jgi:putative membrane protein|nr:YhgE/Pip domain-containing protein [Butyrivibrio sp.]